MLTELLSHLIFIRPSQTGWPLRILGVPKQGKVLKKHHKAMLIKNNSLKRIFPKPPMAGLRQGKNLRRFLCKSRLFPKPTNRPVRSSRTSLGWKRCSKNRKECPICPFMAQPTSQVVSNFNGYKHTIKTNVNCQSTNVIYLWKCKKLNCKDYPKYYTIENKFFQTPKNWNYE